MKRVNEAQGDANRSRDPQPVDPADVWGVGRVLVPYVGYPAAWLAMGTAWKTALSVIAMSLAVGSSRWALFSRYDPWLDRGGAT